MVTLPAVQQVSSKTAAELEMLAMQHGHFLKARQLQQVLQLTHDHLQTLRSARLGSCRSCCWLQSQQQTAKPS